MAVRTQMLSQRTRPNPRASLAVLCGVVAVVAIPLGIELTRKVPGAGLLDAVWAIPVAALASVAALLFGRGARGTVAATLGRTSGELRIRAARILTVAGISLTLSASIAILLYELLVRLEH